MTPNTATATLRNLYSHPDGGEILYATKSGTILISEPQDDGADCAYVPIAPYGMKLLAYRLLALAVELEGTD